MGIVDRLDDPEATALVPREGDGAADVGLGGEELELEVGRHLDVLHAFHGGNILGHGQVLDPALVVGHAVLFLVDDGLAGGSPSAEGAERGGANELRHHGLELGLARPGGDVPHDMTGGAILVERPLRRGAELRGRQGHNHGVKVLQVRRREIGGAGEMVEVDTVRRKRLARQVGVGRRGELPARRSTDIEELGGAQLVRARLQLGDFARPGHREREVGGGEFIGLGLEDGGGNGEVERGVAQRGCRAGHGRGGARRERIHLRHGGVLLFVERADGTAATAAGGRWRRGHEIPDVEDVKRPAGIGGSRKGGGAEQDGGEGHPGPEGEVSGGMRREAHGGVMIVSGKGF